jgi:hypothetical protein
VVGFDDSRLDTEKVADAGLWANYRLEVGERVRGSAIFECSVVDIIVGIVAGEPASMEPY